MKLKPLSVLFIIGLALAALGVLIPSFASTPPIICPGGGAPVNGVCPPLPTPTGTLDYTQQAAGAAQLSALARAQANGGFDTLTQRYWYSISSLDAAKADYVTAGRFALAAAKGNNPTGEVQYIAIGQLYTLFMQPSLSIFDIGTGYLGMAWLNNLTLIGIALMIVSLMFSKGKIL